MIIMDSVNMAICKRKHLLIAVIGVLLIIQHSRAIVCGNNEQAYTDENGEAFCSCLPNFTGQNCEEPLLCPDKQCENKGICYLMEDYRRCVCREGSAGSYCEIVVTAANSGIKCRNDGVRVKRMDNGKELCQCQPNYMGEYCEISVMVGHCTPDACISSDCINHTKATFGCRCKPGFGDLRCNKITDSCYSSPCQNNGICTPTTNNFVCNCPAGFAGALCEISTCRAHTCKYGSCINTEKGFRCDCYSGYTGPQCDQRLPWCYTNPCKHGGTCQPRGDHFACLCPEGFTGGLCEKDVAGTRLRMEDLNKPRRKPDGKSAQEVFVSVCVAIFAGVFVLFLYTYYKERRERGLSLITDGVRRKTSGQKRYHGRMFHFPKLRFLRGGGGNTNSKNEPDSDQSRTVKSEKSST